MAELTINLLAVIPTTGDAPQEGSYGMLTIYAIVALGFSFLCSVAEAVLLSVSPSYIATLQDSGGGSAARLKRMKENVDRPLSAILSLNTIAHTVGAAGVGAQAAGIWGSSAVGYASALMTLLILILSEIIPKTIGAVYWRQLAPSVAQGLEVLIWLLFPLVWMSELMTKLIAGEKQEIVTREEVAATAAMSSEAGELEHGEHRILTNLLKLRSLQVDDIMTPRTVIFAFPEETTVGELLSKRSKLPVSRIPVFEDSIDRTTGFVLKTDVLLAQANDQPDTKLKELRRPLKAIPATASLSDALELLLNQREHIALVVDEYGGADGLVTMEDVIETLLGAEIIDEHDQAADMQRVARRQWKKRLEAVGLEVEEPNAAADNPADAS
ncbi:Hemolysin C [Posidoniimonas polymericola]|uniref:Hemolysin C n=1 Tax=Posidoniimonas polymericola TaxID=2528002 RepID=A0A5C5YM37_9BACT|nr:hemolysin family protein [Posidoniimonas polymericola]TWT75972.1 Hemolysin C [Posidoniimonas polymericola]